MIFGNFFSFSAPSSLAFIIFFSVLFVFINSFLLFPRLPLFCFFEFQHLRVSLYSFSVLDANFLEGKEKTLPSDGVKIEIKEKNVIVCLHLMENLNKLYLLKT
jgi:hypothetical protein